MSEFAPMLLKKISITGNASVVKFRKDAIYLFRIENEQQKMDDKFDKFKPAAHMKEQTELNNRLILCIAGSDLSEAKRLINQGAQVNAKVELKRDSLRIIKEKIHSELGKIIIGELKVVDKNPDIPVPCTPLAMAAFTGQTEMVRLLIEKGADVNADTNGFFNASNLAAMEGHTDILNILIDSEADIEWQGAQIVMSAAGSGHIETLDRLFEIDPSFSTQEIKNLSLIMAVCFGGGQTEMVKHLISNGADANATDYADMNKTVGPSVLHTAARKGYTEIVQILVEAGANVNDRRTTDQKTALDYAKENGHTEIVEFLKKFSAKK